MDRFRSFRRVGVLAMVAFIAALLVPAGASAAGVVDADAGEYYSLAVLSDGTLWGWGYNSQGQLGDGTLEKHLSPSKIAGTSWVDVSAGFRHSLAVRNDGSLWSWGYNKDGQLGIGHAENTFVPDHWHWTPTRVGAGTAWIQIAAGYDHSVALDLDGAIWAWGANDAGQLGNGTTAPTAEPVLVSSSPGLGRSWSRVWADDALTMALASDGSLWQWGRGSLVPVQVGFTSPLSPVSSDDDWITLSTAGDRVAATMSDSGLWAWQVGSSPDPVFFNYEYLDVAETTEPGQQPTAEWALVLGLDHSLWIATSDVGTPVRLLNADGDPAPKKYIIGNALNWTELNAGRNHFLLSKSDGSLWGWGKNTFGQLGDGTEYHKDTRGQVPVRAILPTPIPRVTGMTQSDAEDRVREMGFKVGTVTFVATDSVEVTRIISQSPTFDTLVMPGGSVNLVVSAGPPVAVPNVVGLPEVAARTSIGNAGLGVSYTTQAYSSSVPAGAVISQNPSAGAPVIVASKVSLVISRGRQPRAVPYTTGRTEAQARSVLTGAGFVVGSVVKEYSTTFAAGLVTRTSPTAGTQALVGDVVRIYVSLGKPKVSLGTPHAPSTMYTTKYATVYGTLRPRHTAGTYPVRIYRWKKTSSGWKSYPYISARAYNYNDTTTKYARSIRLSEKGTWKLRAYAPADSKHAATWSTSSDYVTVK